MVRRAARVAPTAFQAAVLAERPSPQVTVPSLVVPQRSRFDSNRTGVFRDIREMWSRHVSPAE